MRPTRAENVKKPSKDPFQSYKEAVARTALESLATTSKNSVGSFAKIPISSSESSSSTSSEDEEFNHNPRAKFIQRLSQEIRDATNKKDLKAFAKQQELESKNFSRKMKDRKASKAKKNRGKSASPTRNKQTKQKPKPKSSKQKTDVKKTMKKPTKGSKSVPGLTSITGTGFTTIGRAVKPQVKKKKKVVSRIGL